MLPLILKSLGSFVVIAGVETLHGIFRVQFLNRRLGDRRARQLGVFTGSIIIFIITWLLFPWLAPADERESLLLGLLWFILMLAFDIGLGRLVFHFSWKRIAAEFDLSKGNFLLLGMLFMLFAPWLVFLLRA